MLLSVQAEADSSQFSLRIKCVKVTGQFGGAEVFILIDGGLNYRYVRAEVVRRGQV